MITFIRGSRHAGADHQPPEALLEPAPRPRAPAQVNPQRRLQHLDPPPSVRPSHRGERGVQIEPLAIDGLMDHERDLVRVHDLGEIDRRPGHRGHGDAVHDRDVAPVEVAAGSQPEPRLSTPLLRDEHLDLALPSRH